MLRESPRCSQRYSGAYDQILQYRSLVKMPAMIDCHAHFFDPDRPEGIIWPPRSAPYYGRKLVGEYQHDLGKFALGGTIIVEASRRESDDLWMADFAQNEGFIKGYIANLQPDESGFAERLKTHLGQPKFKGLRLRPIELFKLDGDSAGAICKMLIANNKVLELGAKTPDRLPQIYGLAQAHPKLNIILDHAGHPDLSLPKGDQIWESNLSSTTLPDNLWWKLTPYLGSHGHGSAKSRNSLARCLEHISAHVRPDRILLGSNWPVSPATSYAEMVSLVAIHLPFLIEDNMAMTNGIQVYNLDHVDFAIAHRPDQ